MRTDDVQQGDRATPAIALRALAVADLADVNRVIEAAMASWDIAPRVMRLALPSYQYRHDDFDHVVFIGAWRGDELLGFVSLEPADPRASPGGCRAALLHGLYVIPDAQGAGIGTRLVDEARAVAGRRGFEGLVVRAERNANAFFEKVGFAALPIEDHQRDYPYRLWSPLDSASRPRPGMA